jgi:hypothetical protein
LPTTERAEGDVDVEDALQSLRRGQSCSRRTGVVDGRLCGVLPRPLKGAILSSSKWS